jgi:hypothetical protein
MKALISPQENNRIADVTPTEFPVAAPLFWVDCPDNVTTEWTYDGEFSPPVIQQETPEQIIVRLESALDRHLDAVANQYRYESIRTMVTYATSEHPTFGNEGRAAVKWRDAVYAYGIQCLQDVQAEQREIPTEEELIAELPLFEDYL